MIGSHACRLTVSTAAQKSVAAIPGSMALTTAKLSRGDFGPADKAAARAPWRII